jgi:uncharacterized membrane protein
LYDFLLTVHVLAATLWVGGAVTLHIALRRAMKSATGQELHGRVAELEEIGGRFYPIFSLILIVAGVFLVDEAGYEFDQTWITLALTGWVISFLIGITFYPREGKRRGRILAEHGPESPAVGGSIRRTVMVNSFEMLILLLVVVDMTTKPGL